MSLAERVARRFQAELLTKSWLMGVRRGWLSLMKPQVNDYNDVFRALGRLWTFAKNLQDQVFNVRQIINKDSDEITKAFAKLLSEIERAGGTAEHWKNAYEGNVPFPDPRQREDGERMLELYRTNFDGAVSGSKPKRGKGGLVREASLTEFFDDLLKLLYAESKTLGEKGQGTVYEDTVFREFSYGRLKVIVVDPKHRGQRIRAYVRFVEISHALLKKRGFGDLWYGAMFLMSDDYEKLTPEEKKAYEEAGYKNMESRAGTYHSGADIIKITAPPEPYLVTTIVHEMGHRYWHKSMNGAQRARFESLVEGDWSMIHAILLNHRLLSDDEHRRFSDMYRKVEVGRDLSVEEKSLIDAKFSELGLRVGVPLVSDYARSRPTEAFAEVFTRYVLSDGLSQDQVESFRAVLASNAEVLLMPPHPREPCGASYSYFRSSAF